MSWGVFRKKGKKNGNKYGNKKITIDGIEFDSRLEAGLFRLLSLRKRGGEICDLAHQPGTVFLSDARIQYRPDFSYTTSATGKKEFAESKGFETPAWRIKRKLWLSYGPAPLHIFKGSAARLTLTETLIPRRKA